MAIATVTSNESVRTFTHHRAVAMMTPTPMQSTNTTQSRNSIKSTKCNFSTIANPTEDAKTLSHQQSSVCDINRTSTISS